MENSERAWREYDDLLSHADVVLVFLLSLTFAQSINTSLSSHHDENTRQFVVIARAFEVKCNRIECFKSIY